MYSWNLYFFQFSVYINTENRKFSWEKWWAEREGRMEKDKSKVYEKAKNQSFEVIMMCCSCTGYSNEDVRLIPWDLGY